MGARMETELVLNALLMAVWHRRPQQQVMVHSDQGSQFNSHEWQTFLKAHNLVASMSRRGNFWDNAVAENFFSYCRSVNEYVERYIRLVMMHGWIYLTTSRFFIIGTANMVLQICCRR